jgi:hypothetical protein
MTRALTKSLVFLGSTRRSNASLFHVTEPTLSTNSVTVEDISNLTVRFQHMVCLPHFFSLRKKRCMKGGSRIRRNLSRIVSCEICSGQKSKGARELVEKGNIYVMG